MSNIGFQAGDFSVIRSYYPYVLERINAFADNLVEFNVLNIGSGIKFDWERILYERYKKFSINIDSIDINSPNIIPEYINFTTEDIERPIKTQKVYNCIFAFEVLEHVDNTDELIKNAHNGIDKDGVFFIAVPNLASLFSRIELLFGYQPHILEVSNEKANFGTGRMGFRNNPPNIPIHHIRGVSYRAMLDMLDFHGFSVISKRGYIGKKQMPKCFTGLGSVILYECKKKQGRI